MADSVTKGQQDLDPSDPVTLARELVATPSVNPALDPGGAGEAEIAELTAGWLRDWGFDVALPEAAPGRPSVLARLERGDGPSLILNGHLDTVGIDGMRFDPFDPVIDDDRLRGRGSADMKGGVAAALAAARDAADRGFRGTLIVALTADEEEAGRGARQLVADGLRADGAIVCEPTGLDIMPAHKGFTWVELGFRGRAAHGSRPDRGVDAIRHAALFLARMEALESTLAARDRHPLLGTGSVHAGTIRGGTAPSVYPDSCTLTLERRTLPGEGLEAFHTEVEFALGELRSELPQLDASLEVTLHRDGSEIPSHHPLVAAMLEAARSTGLEPATVGMSAWVEASTFNGAGIPALCFGPGRIEDAHSADESVAVDEIRAAHRALSALVEAMLA
ncbi:MAG: ArgE/DapE family deacylase [Candidatus Longimicrobiales bacterium M2_2A_002]